VLHSFPVWGYNSPASAVHLLCRPCVWRQPVRRLSDLFVVCEFTVSCISVSYWSAGFFFPGFDVTTVFTTSHVSDLFLSLSLYKLDWVFYHLLCCLLPRLCLFTCSISLFHGFWCSTLTHCVFLLALGRGKLGLKLYVLSGMTHSTFIEIPSLYCCFPVVFRARILRLSLSCNGSRSASIYAARCLQEMSLEPFPFFPCSVA
jgi:hypothetical protein